MVVAVRTSLTILAVKTLLPLLPASLACHSAGESPLASTPLPLKPQVHETSTFPGGSKFLSAPAPPNHFGKSVWQGSFFGVHRAQGGRPYQEDRFKVVMGLDKSSNPGSGEWDFYAVYDGHGGSAAVDRVRERLHTIVRDEARKVGWDRAQMKSALERAFLRMDRELHGPVDATVINSGACATVALVSRRQGVYFVAHVGDSRAMEVVDSGTYETSHPGLPHGRMLLQGAPLTVDHQASNSAEAARVRRAGGVVRKDPHGTWRVDGSLMVTRSFGDFALKGPGGASGKVTALPEVKQYKLRRGGPQGGRRPEYKTLGLVLASDGIWDSLNERQVAQSVADSYSRPDEQVGRRSLEAEAGGPVTTVRESHDGAARSRVVAADLVKKAGYKTGDNKVALFVQIHPEI